MIRSCAVLLVLIALAAGSAQGQPAGAPDRPNVVLILIDDLKWADTGVYGSAF